MEIAWAPVPCIPHQSPTETSPTPGGDRTNQAPLGRRYKSASAYDAKRQTIYLVGGRQNNMARRDLWSYSLRGGTWRRVPVDLPRMESCSAVIDSSHTHLYIFGGQYGDSRISATESLLIHPLAQLEAVTHGTQSDTVHISKHANNTGKLQYAQLLVPTKVGSSKAKGSNVAVDGPVNCRGHAAAVLHDHMYVYGGFSDTTNSMDQFWRLKTKTDWAKSPTAHWTKLTDPVSRTSPGPRHHHSLTACQGQLWLYGGMSNLVERGDLWRYRPAMGNVAGQWEPMSCRGGGPGKLYGHSAVAHDRMIFIFGGIKADSGQYSDELWCLNTDSSSWTKLSSSLSTAQPHPSAFHCLVRIPTPTQETYANESHRKLVSGKVDRPRVKEKYQQNGVEKRFVYQKNSITGDSHRSKSIANLDCQSQQRPDPQQLSEIQLQSIDTDTISDSHRGRESNSTSKTRSYSVGSSVTVLRNHNVGARPFSSASSNSSISSVRRCRQKNSVSSLSHNHHLSGCSTELLIQDDSDNPSLMVDNTCYLPGRVLNDEDHLTPTPTPRVGSRTSSQSQGSHEHNPLAITELASTPTHQQSKQVVDAEGQSNPLMFRGLPDLVRSVQSINRPNERKMIHINTDANRSPNPEHDEMMEMTTFTKTSSDPEHSKTLNSSLESGQPQPDLKSAAFGIHNKTETVLLPQVKNKSSLCSLLVIGGQQELTPTHGTMTNTGIPMWLGTIFN